MTIERAADAIIKSDWPGYREAIQVDATGDVLVIDPSGAWETYAAQSARLDRADRKRNLLTAWGIAFAIACNTIVAFLLGAWWALS